MSKLPQERVHSSSMQVKIGEQADSQEQKLRNKNTSSSTNQHKCEYWIVSEKTKDMYKWREEKFIKKGTSKRDSNKGYCLGTLIGGNRYPHIWDSIFLLYLNVEYQTDQVEGKAVHSNKLVDISQSHSSCTSPTEKGFSPEFTSWEVN